jgi:hypothetical protein
LEGETGMLDLTQHNELVITQQVEHLEAFVGFETANICFTPSKSPVPLAVSSLAATGL